MTARAYDDQIAAIPATVAEVLAATEPAEVIWLDEGGQWGEPSHHATRVIHGGAAALLPRQANCWERKRGRSCHRYLQLNFGPKKVY